LHQDGPDAPGDAQQLSGGPCAPTCFMGRAGLINSGGGSGKNDLADAVRTAVINKRAGGTGLISGRKTFQRPMAEGVELFTAIQDVFLSKEVTVA
jgi:class I fructose-bisphosphate aldolase